jgi:hypothetical protein
MRYLLAIIACVIIWVLYIALGSALFGWEHGGGAIPMIIMFGIMAFTWRAIVKH